ncbi:hypothetical protein KKD62_02700 [Patescibacteria group bacterium]|nr:hypothetical protein [Patescibacteria group bacterium]MBU1931849.1 hypothetical protein [Patescibacteria group bacterium]
MSKEFFYRLTAVITVCSLLVGCGDSSVNTTSEAPVEVPVGGVAAGEALSVLETLWFAPNEVLAPHPYLADLIEANRSPVAVEMRQQWFRKFESGEAVCVATCSDGRHNLVRAHQGIEGQVALVEMPSLAGSISENAAPFYRDLADHAQFLEVSTHTNEGAGLTGCGAQGVKAQLDAAAASGTVAEIAANPELALAVEYIDRQVFSSNPIVQAVHDAQRLHQMIEGRVPVVATYFDHVTQQMHVLAVWGPDGVITSVIDLSTFDTTAWVGQTVSAEVIQSIPGLPEYLANNQAAAAANAAEAARLGFAEGQSFNILVHRDTGMPSSLFTGNQLPLGGRGDATFDSQVQVRSDASLDTFTAALRETFASAEYGLASGHAQPGLTRLFGAFNSVERAQAWANFLLHDPAGQAFLGNVAMHEAVAFVYDETGLIVDVLMIKPRGVAVSAEELLAPAVVAVAEAGAETVFTSLISEQEFASLQAQLGEVETAEAALTELTRLAGRSHESGVYARMNTEGAMEFTRIEGSQIATAMNLKAWVGLGETAPSYFWYDSQVLLERVGSGPGYWRVLSSPDKLSSLYGYIEVYTPLIEALGLVTAVAGTAYAWYVPLSQEAMVIAAPQYSRGGVRYQSLPQAPDVYGETLETCVGLAEANPAGGYGIAWEFNGDDLVAGETGMGWGEIPIGQRTPLVLSSAIGGQFFDTRGQLTGDSQLVLVEYQRNQDGSLSFFQPGTDSLWPIDEDIVIRVLHPGADKLDLTGSGRSVNSFPWVPGGLLNPIGLEQAWTSQTSMFSHYQIKIEPNGGVSIRLLPQAAVCSPAGCEVVELY